MTRVLFVTTFNTHYRDGLFRALRERVDLDLLFYSDGGEWYWQGPTRATDDPRTMTLPGFWVGHTRVVPALVREVSVRPYDVIVKCINGKFALPVCYAAAQMRKKPFVLWTGMWREPSSLVHRAMRRARRHIERSADAIVTYGRHVTDRLATDGIDRSKIFEAPQAVDSHRYPVLLAAATSAQGVRRRFGISPDDPLVLFVGRLEPGKGALTLLAAFASVAGQRRARLAFAGDGSLGRAIQEQVEVLGVKGRVHLLGRVENDDLASLYGVADVVAVPSEITAMHAEPWGLVVNEAMAAGACVVASDAVGAVRHGLVRDGTTGLVFAAGRVDALARTLEKVLGDDRLRRSIAGAGHREVHTYTYDTMAGGFVDAVEFALASRRPLAGA